MRTAWPLIIALAAGCSADEPSSDMASDATVATPAPPEFAPTYDPPPAAATPSARVARNEPPPVAAPAPSVAVPAPPKPAVVAEVPPAEVISVAFDRPEYHFTRDEADRGVRMKYVITVRENVWVTPDRQTASAAARPGAGGLYPIAEIVGDEQYFTERGAADGKLRPSRFFLKRGTYTSFVEWHGRNGAGPADAASAERAPFPPGAYEVGVRVVGQVERRTETAPYSAAATAVVVLGE